MLGFVLALMIFASQIMSCFFLAKNKFYILSVD